MKYDWTSLKRKFITRSKGNKKYSLKQFAEDEKINYRTLRDNASGWIKARETKQRQKNDKLTDKIIESQIESEAEINKHHYDMANRLLGVMGQTFDIGNLVNSPKSINTLAKALKTLQEIQRTASGLDKQGNNGSNVIAEFIKGVIDENADTQV